MLIIETPVFTRLVQQHLDDDQYCDLQEMLRKRPDVGDVIPGSGGLRKMRWSGSGRGKRGGLRVIYYWRTRLGQILMLFLYPKNEQDDLSKDQLKALRTIIEEEYHEKGTI